MSSEKAGTSGPACVSPSPATSVALATAGFLYVGVVLCGRTNPLRTAHGHGEDLPLALIFVASVTGLWRFAASRKNSRTERIRGLDTPFLAGFTAALHLQCLVRLTGVDFTLTPGGTRFSPGVVAALGAAAVAIGVMIFLHVREAARAGFAGLYVVLVAAPQAVILAVTLTLLGSWHLHYHHYLLGATLLPFACFRPAWSRLAQGILLGLFIEGASRWGLDPIWYALKK